MYTVRYTNMGYTDGNTFSNATAACDHARKGGFESVISYVDEKGKETPLHSFSPIFGTRPLTY